MIQFSHVTLLYKSTKLFPIPGVTSFRPWLRQASPCMPRHVPFNYFALWCELKREPKLRLPRQLRLPSPPRVSRLQRDPPHLPAVPEQHRQMPVRQVSHGVFACLVHLPLPPPGVLNGAFTFHLSSRSAAVALPRLGAAPHAHATQTRNDTLICILDKLLQPCNRVLCLESHWLELHRAGVLAFIW